MKRNANFEVLRCLLMFLIVLYHCAHFGIYNESRSWWLFPLTTLLMWHVDCFILISGWFGIRPTFGKFFRLWGVVLFYSLVSFAWDTFHVGSFALREFSMRGGWFVGAYLALMLIAPILNAAVDGLVARSERDFLVAWGLCFLMLFLSWIPGGGGACVRPGGVHGGTLFVLGFVYFTARGLHVVMTKPIPRLLLIAVMMAFVLMSLALQFGWYWLKGCQGVPVAFSDQIGRIHYNAPHIIVMAVAVFLYFAWYVKVPHWIAGIASVCGPSMFAVYLLHGPCSFGHDLYRSLQFWLSRVTWLHPFVVVIISAAAVWTGCLFFDLIVRRGGRRFVFWMLGRQAGHD